MVRIIDWAAAHARMVVAIMLLSIGVGIAAYFGLPKEGAPDIEFPGYYISVPFNGISAEDSEDLLVKPLEEKLEGLDGLDFMQSTAAEGYGGIFLQFEFGLDADATLAEIREQVSQAASEFPDEASDPIISEISLAEFPIIIVVLSGDLPERTMQSVAKSLQDEIESLAPILEVGITGERSEMIEVIVEPIRLEAYDVTPYELIASVNNNNQLIAAGEVESASGSFAVKVPVSYDGPDDVAAIPIITNGDRVVKLGDLAKVYPTFQDRTGIARHNGETTIALPVVKRKGFNIIETSRIVRDRVTAIQATWPEELQSALAIDFVHDQSVAVEAMISQLQGSVMTAVLMVMIVVLATLGIRSSILVGFAVPSSFLLCFTFLALLDIPISNIVMFGLILSVGMLVDSAIVVVELADRRMAEGSRPMSAYVEAAKRMFWPVISSTTTTLCAFLPMLFWPGLPGQFMGSLPITLIFVLSASLCVALIFLPVVGGVAARTGMRMSALSLTLTRLHWTLRGLLVLLFLIGLFGAAIVILNPGLFFNGALPFGPIYSSLPGIILFVLFTIGMGISINTLRPDLYRKKLEKRQRRTLFGLFIQLIVGNPVMPVVVLALTAVFTVIVFRVYATDNHGVQFFVEAEPERALVNVLAQGNLSLEEKDALVRSVEKRILGTEGVSSIYSTTGEGGLNNFGNDRGPADTVGTIQLEFDLWENRQLLEEDLHNARAILNGITQKLTDTPGIKTDVTEEVDGPQQGKPLSLRLTSTNYESLLQASAKVRQKFDNTVGLAFIDDTLPLPGIDWEVDIDVVKAGLYDADIATVGAIIQFATRGVLLDTLRTDTSDEEIEIRVRFPEDDRLLSTLEDLRLRTSQGLVPLSNFLEIKPVRQFAEIKRYNSERYFIINADIAWGAVNDEGRPVSANERIDHLTQWLTEEAELPPDVKWEWTGDREEQQESQAFLMYAFIGALGLMFAVLLAQFNSVYNSLLVLFAVILSTTGVLIGMLLLEQPFSVIMTGIGIVSLAGIVVNNNIVLIDTYQEYARMMPRIEAIIRTAELRIRPVMLTTITTIAALTPMMLGWSLDFINGGYTIDSPTALWWKQLATAIVFGLATASVLTLVVTPSLLAIPVWLSKSGSRTSRIILTILGGKGSRVSQDRALQRDVAKLKGVTLPWDQLRNVLMPVYPARDELHLRASGHALPETPNTIPSATQDPSIGTRSAAASDDSCNPPNPA